MRRQRGCAMRSSSSTIRAWMWSRTIGPVFGYSRTDRSAPRTSATAASTEMDGSRSPARPAAGSRRRCPRRHANAPETRCPASVRSSRIWAARSVRDSVARRPAAVRGRFRLRGRHRCTPASTLSALAAPLSEPGVDALAAAGEIVAERRYGLLRGSSSADGRRAAWLDATQGRRYRAKSTAAGRHADGRRSPAAAWARGGC